LLRRGCSGHENRPPAIEPLTPAWASRIRLPLSSRFSSRTLAEHVRLNPGMAFVTDDGRQYAIAGPWRRRADIAELVEVSDGKHRLTLLNALLASLTSQGVQMVVVDYGPRAVDPGLCREAGLAVIERIVEYERPDCRVQPRPSALEVRSYRPEDHDAVLDVERHSFPWLWWNSPDEWEAYVSLPSVGVVVGIAEGRIVGYAGFTVYHRDGHLDRLAVRESDQGRGFGSALLVEALRRMDQTGARRVRLTTQEDNRRSQTLYERYGFRRGRWIYEIYGRWLNQPEGTRL
jgi:ribosomal protein S18 acetylase RimI-like enzyme